MLFNLKEKDRRSGCSRCNFVGCSWERKRHPLLGHWRWAFRYWASKYGVLGAFRRLKQRLSAVNTLHVEVLDVEGINHSDYCDAFIAAANYKGKLMSEQDLERLNQDRDFVYAAVEQELN